MSKVAVIFVCLILIFGFIIKQGTEAASVDSISLSNYQCEPDPNFNLPSVQITLSGIFDTDDNGGGEDLVRIQIIDGDGNSVYSEDHTGNVGSNQLQDTIYLGFGGVEPPEANPLQVNIYEIVDFEGDTLGLLQSDEFNSPCLSRTGTGNRHQIIRDPVIVQEEARGIARVFDDGIVITRQPDGAFEYYLPDGCLIGRTEASIFENANLSLRYLSQSYVGCGGYRVDLWSLGFPACQMQVNMYGPNGYEKVYQLERRMSEPLCVDVQAQIPTNLPFFAEEPVSRYWTEVKVNEGVSLSPACVVFDDNPLGYYTTFKLFWGWNYVDANGDVFYGLYADGQAGPYEIVGSFTYIECGIPGNP